MTAIRRIKTGHYGPPELEALKGAARELMEQGAEVMILACTELSVIGEGLGMPTRMVDASQVLAEAIVRTVKGGTTS